MGISRVVRVNESTGGTIRALVRARGLARRVIGSGGGVLLLSSALLVTPGRAQQTLSLRQAIERAMQGPGVAVAEARVGVAQGQRRQASLGLNPRLYLQSEDLRPWEKTFSFPNNTEDYGYVGQTFEIDGKRRKRMAVADASVQRAETERELRSRQIGGAVAGAYWTAASNMRIVTLLEQDLAAVDAMVRYHKERVDAGAMRGLDLIRIQIERDRVYLLLQAAERDAELARTDLFRQIGMTTDPKVVLSDDIMTSDELPEIDLSTALSRRVEITLARDEVDAAEADIRLQRALGVPDPDVFLGYKRNSGADTAYVALQIPLPLRNRNQGEIARAQAQLRVAKATLAQTEISVRAEIEAATENYHRELAIVHETLPEMRTRAKQNLDILTEAYRIGGADLLRYIDAERVSLDVEVTAIRTLAEYHQAVLRLQLAYAGQL